MRRTWRFGISASVLCIFMACATADRKTFSQYSDEVAVFLDRGQFEQARSVVRGKGQMCLQFAPNGYCPAADPNAESKILSRIDRVQQCDDLLKKIDDGTVKTREQVVRSRDQVQENCRELELPSGMVVRSVGAENQLNQIEAAGPASETFSDGTPNPVAAARNRCMLGMRWGYPHMPKTAEQTIAGRTEAPTGKTYLPGRLGDASALMVVPSKDPALLRGEFAAKDACEEARLTDVDMVGDHCIQRYLGEPQKVKIAKIQMMYGDAGQGPSKTTIWFSSLETCQRARQRGFEDSGDELVLIDRGGKESWEARPGKERSTLQKILPFGSSGTPRLIGNCAEAERMLCGRYAEDLEELSVVN